MDLYSLVSIVAALKQKFQMLTPTDSFCIASKQAQPYIEPTFAKVVFSTERPTVILTSAVGATGKSTLAQVDPPRRRGVAQGCRWDLSDGNYRRELIIAKEQAR